MNQVKSHSYSLPRSLTSLINGASGIAVGMATNIPPHNITETVDACIAVLDNPALSLVELMQLVPGA